MQDAVAGLDRAGSARGSSFRGRGRLRFRRFGVPGPDEPLEAAGPDETLAGADRPDLGELAVEVVEGVEHDRFGEHRHNRGAELVPALVGEHQVLQLEEGFGRKVRNLRCGLPEEIAPQNDVPDEAADRGVLLRR